MNGEQEPLLNAKPQRERSSGSSLIGKIIYLILLITCTIIFFAPFLWLISASLKVRSDVFNNELIPDPVAWQNYVNVWKAAPMLDWLKNSLVVGFLAATTVTASCSMIAFGFSYFRFRGRDTLFGFVLATMMLPGVVTMIPVFLIWNSLGLANTQIPLWAGNLFGSAFYIFMIRQFYLSLPRELYEAARVDGSSYFGLWRHIALPLSRTALIVVFVFEFRASWTDLVKPLIYLHKTELYTLPLGLKSLLDQFGQGGELQWEIVLAASVIVTIPMIIIFFLGQRYFLDGIARTGIKG
ncbi:MAG: carbohydrate ABC transporter permease [Anaerolineae bacterium]|nr:carbohydrate ABC transporter permease [Anaerolineae bacterium]